MGKKWVQYRVYERDQSMGRGEHRRCKKEDKKNKVSAGVR